MEAHCPLCRLPGSFHCQAWKRSIYRCPACDLRFVPPGQWLSPGQEAERYRLHQNRITDDGYVRFLMPVVDCLRRHGVKGRVLDYGAGPAPVLVEILRREGYEAVGYDPVFEPARGDACRETGGRDTPQGDPTGGMFDAVVSTEVFEHFREPGRDLDRLVSVLKPGGWLVAMTELFAEGVDMAVWPYANDPTHILFYSPFTFQVIARRWGFDLVECAGKRLVALRLRFSPCGCADSGPE